MAIAPGQLVGNYQVLSRLGVGGMGTVYLAEHPIIGKKVALKVIHRELAGNREVIGRFYQEARAVNLIGNEHIVEIHDFGASPDGDPFFIMEYVDGKTLAQVLSRERILDVGRALHITAQIALALGATHAAGIIHRDLQPDNVMLSLRNGDPDFVKLLDFGLAKVAAEGSVKALTAAGVILGTPQYMSPEACESKKVDHRTDIYALGVLLFQMLCGQVPFDADTMGGVLIKQVTQPPPAPRGLSPLIPPAVEQIILRCLAKQPDARFGSMHELHVALCDPDRYLGNTPSPQRAAQPTAAAQQATMFAVETNAAMGYAATAGLPAYSTTAMGAAQLGTAATASHAVVAPPRTTGPVHAQATLMVDAMPPPAATMMAPPPPAADAMPRRMTAAPMAVPQNHTLVLSTPPGFTSGAPRKKSGAWIAIGAVVAVIGAVVAVVVLSGGGSDDAAAVTEELDGGGEVAGSGTGAPVPTVDAAVAAVDAAPAPVVMAKVTITSDPRGAEVLGPDGAVLGVTPTTISLPIDGRAVTLVLRKSGYKERDKIITATGDLTVSVLLEAERRSGSGRKPEGGGRGTGSGTGRGPSAGGDKIDMMEPTYR